MREKVEGQGRGKEEREVEDSRENGSGRVPRGDMRAYTYRRSVPVELFFCPLPFVGV